MKARIVIDQRIAIATTPDTIFNFACDYRNDPDWRSGVEEMSIDSTGDTHTGDQTQEVMRVLGRTTRTRGIITAHEPCSHTVFRTVAGDLIAAGYRQTRRMGDESAFTYHAEALLDRRLRFFARTIERLLNRRVARDLRKLADILTSPGTNALSN
ncbi:MAG: SRPBCC family protein [Ornithinimicrobium sp.]